MKTLVSFQELDELGEKLVKEYLKTTHRWNSLSVDIEGFITEFMGEKVEYPYFAEEDPNRIGFAGDGINALLVWNGNAVEERVYDDKTIVIDRSMLDVEQSGRRRYTLAHEAAHKILKKHVPLQAVSCFCTVHDGSADYDYTELKRIHSFNEICANRLGAALLMPQFLMERVLRKYNEARHVVVYDGGVFSEAEKLKIDRMKNAMGVSYSAFINRLRELEMLDTLPFDIYMKEKLKVGREK